LDEAENRHLQERDGLVFDSQSETEGAVECAATVELAAEKVDILMRFLGYTPMSRGVAMKGFPAVLSQRTNTLLIISTAAVFSVVDLCSPAQAQGVNVRSEVFFDGMLARGVRHELSVPNVLNVPIMLDSVKISVSNRKDLTWPEPNWELLPFLDFLVIKVRNDGWEGLSCKGARPICCSRAVRSRRGCWSVGSFFQMSNVFETSLKRKAPNWHQGTIS